MSLGFFASFAAPFGGFLSSAIKRAYGIKEGVHESQPVGKGEGNPEKHQVFLLCVTFFNQSLVSLKIMLEYEIEFLKSSVGFTIGNREGAKNGKEVLLRLPSAFSDF